MQLDIIPNPTIRIEKETLELAEKVKALYPDKMPEINRHLNERIREILQTGIDVKEGKL